ncbi:MAG: pancreas/duodenum homeobox protein 1 [Desulfobacteraceae bacterium]|nr:pancreas/duodenum homeobox protein 1 [Desulfobacteraceae bacterium]
MSGKDCHQIFTPEVLAGIFPPERADQFFEALFGDASEGAYDITLVFRECREAENRLQFELQLHERPGKCLACNLTYGLPEVFSRHPLLDFKGVARELAARLGATCKEWRLGTTQSRSRQLHVVPFTIILA